MNQPLPSVNTEKNKPRKLVSDELPLTRKRYKDVHRALRIYRKKLQDDAVLALRAREKMRSALFTEIPDDDVPNPVVSLASVSERDRPWDHRRRASDKIRKIFASGDEWQQHNAERMKSCGRVLTFGVAANGSHTLRSARFCRVRLCEVCQWRRSLAWKARYHSAEPILRKIAPDARYLFLTLTVPNCKVENLAATLKKMTLAWKRMQSRKHWPVIGFLRSTEVTIEENRPGYVHPHYHIILAVKPSYFESSNYMDVSEWHKRWAKSLEMEEHELALPNIKAVPKDEMEDALKETVKYSVKFSSVSKDERPTQGEWRETFLELDRQLKGFYATRLGGIFREAFRDEEVSDEEMIAAEEVAAEEVQEYRQYVWSRASNCYVFLRCLSEDEFHRLRSEDRERLEDMRARAGPLPEPIRPDENLKFDWWLNREMLDLALKEARGSR